ncbi:DUF333 domain-containing protein [Candidatus Woesearchaeota archaeon]|nr:DUF333 domain-containing protein [Candidatus Woesearchaeota archaeon]
MRYSHMIISAMLILAIMSLTGCRISSQKYMLTDQESRNKETIEKSGVANPATLHCMNTTGAAWAMKEDAKGGQYGVCTFSDASWCEEWAYYRGECLPGMNMTGCGEYWGKTTCPQDYNPVCAKTGDDPDDWQTFNNACKACLKSEGNAQGYVLGACE